ncbi:MAG TPA: hypothetical protein VLG67_01800, partial [Candidatus Saccharimonadales bacterium]|nr:hypothetical protein [Candidatus Saccharimonadales bacterium]
RKFDKLANPVTSGCGTTIPPASWADGVYWCTYSVIDAYKLAGIDGLTAGNSGFVVYMPQVFASTPGLKYVQYENADHQTALKQVGSGFAMIMATPDDNNAHVALVKTIQIDDRGNGTIVSLESNSSAKSHTYTIANWVIEPISWPIRGFGGK